MKSFHDNARELAWGWAERVEYRVEVKSHVVGCMGKLHDDYECDCKTVNEGRVKTIQHPSLIRQLQDYAHAGDPGPSDGAERGSPNKASSRPPGNMAGFHLLDEIAVEANYLCDRVMIELSRDRSYALVSVAESITRIAEERKRINEQDMPHLCRDIDRQGESWVKRARDVLHHNSKRSVLVESACIACGGTLVVADTQVECIGTPNGAPCGKTYGPKDYLDILANTATE